MVLRKLFDVDANTNGKGKVLFQWATDGSRVAIGGAKGRVAVLDRQGKKIGEFDTNAGPIVALDWDSTNEVVACLTEKNSNAHLYHVATKKTEIVETGLKDLTFLKWSPYGPQMAIGNQKGAVLLYNRQTSKKVPILGTHSKKILDGVWNSRGLLAMIGEDKLLSVSDSEGNVLDQVTLKTAPQSLSFCDIKIEDAKNNAENFVCVNLSGKSLFIFNTAKKEMPIEMTFQSKYGSIVTAQFTPEGYCIIGFQSGYVSLVSLHPSELGTEVSSVKAHRDALTDVVYCAALRKVATIGDGCCRVFDMDDNQLSDTKSEKMDIDNEFALLNRVTWTADGQILCVSSKTGGVYAFLTKIPVLSAASGPLVMYLSSLREMTVKNTENEQELARIPIDMEPAFVAVGPGTAAIGMNNQAYIYGFPLNSKAKVSNYGSRTFGSTVETIHVSSNYIAVLLSDGKAQISLIDEKNGSQLQHTQATFPEKADVKVKCIALTEYFFIFGLDNGKLCVFSMADFHLVVDFPHSCGIKGVFPNLTGTRIAFLDVNNAAYVLNPATEVATQIEALQPGTKKFLWDGTEYGVFVGIDPKKFVTYLYTPNSRHGSTCEAIPHVGPNAAEGPCTTPLPYGFAPVALVRGVVTSQMPNGSLATMHLASHKDLYAAQQQERPDAELFARNLSLNRLTQAFACASSAQDVQHLAERALHLLDIDMAIRVYRQLNQPTLVMCLEKIRHIQEKNALIGHVSLILGRFNDAQSFFLRSSRPVLALEMRRDLMHWDQALQLAKTLAPEQVPLLSREYGQQLELRGEYTKALEYFQQGAMTIPKGHDSAELTTQQNAAIAHNELCQAGAARCMIRTGNLRGGIQAASALQSKTVALDCARILEGMKQNEEAGLMYERAEQWEKAATIYIVETKNLKAASRILSKIQSRNILVMFAKAKESVEGSFQEAEQAYAQAEDWDNVVRLKVEYLNDLHGAYVVVRKTRSSEAASIVAKSCRKKGENGAAVEFLVLAKKTQEAFELAQQTNSMTNFEGALLAQVVLKDGVAPPAAREDFLLVANYYDQKNKPDLAAPLYHVGGNFTSALAKYLQTGTEEGIQKAVNVVGKARSDALTNRLIDFLMGETDGQPKDPSYIFKLYMALGSFEKAAKTAVLIANKEQDLGNYRGAHKTLVDTALILQEKGMRIPSDLRRSLMLIHSYLIVKHLVKPLEDHNTASRMLLRVARNIQRFPLHVAAILTSTVLECIKGEFKKSAFDYSCMLLQSDEYRAELNEKHKKKIEGLVRKRGKEEMLDPAEEVSPCPHCQAPVPDTELDCGACKNPIPFCIVTGKHMVLEEWCECGNCKFPALFTPFVRLLRDTPTCPMCEQFVDPSKISKVPNPDLKQFL